MGKQYLIRLDDACPTMDREKWGRMEELLDRFCIRPLVGIVPDCKDDELMRNPYDEDFWEKTRCWVKKKWSIALHGYDHCYISDRGIQGMNPMWARSEFAGVSVQKQKEKIRNGVAITREKGLEPKFFFAPSHTFDENTLVALREESNIRFISDGIGRYPYKYKDFVFIPQIVGHCVNMPIDGIYTFCFHPNTMDDSAFEKLEAFLSKYCGLFVRFDEIDISRFGKKKVLDKLISKMFYQYRKIRGLK